MSLGFNTIRRHPVTNLPGAVGASIMSIPATRRRFSPRAPLSSSLPSRPTTVVVAPGATRRVHIETAAPPAKEQESKQQLYEEAQWVYATVAAPLMDVDTEEVVEEVAVGARALFVYPMQTRERDRVCMRLKTVHPVTGQLKQRWVVVYDPETEARSLSNFALTA